MEHEFTLQIFQILQDSFGDDGTAVYERSPLLQYLNVKTRSASRGSKSRGSFANLYAVYALVEDYLKNNFDKKKNYDEYEGARFTDLLARQRQLPFGNKLQNHALNSRMNEEFKKYFPQAEFVPIMRDAQTNRYWINENLLKITNKRKTVNIARSVIAIIDRYMAIKQSAFKYSSKPVKNFRQSPMKKTRRFQGLLRVCFRQTPTQEFLKSQVMPYYDISTLTRWFISVLT